MSAWLRGYELPAELKPGHQVLGMEKKRAVCRCKTVAVLLKSSLSVRDTFLQTDLICPLVICLLEI